MKKQNITLKVEYANQPPTVNDVPDYAINLLGRALMQAYRRHQKELEEKTNYETKRTKT